jgi:hypothetical protein
MWHTSVLTIWHVLESLPYPYSAQLQRRRFESAWSGGVALRFNRGLVYVNRGQSYA